MHTGSGRAHLFIDAGGSTTRVGIGTHEGVVASHEGASCNPASVGIERAGANLKAAVQAAWTTRPHDVEAVDAVWCCTSTASSSSALQKVAAEVHAALPQRAAAAATLWIANDIAPLLFHDGQVRSRVVAICGTGTGYCALHPPWGRCVRASGYEYLLSDEGSGFDIGLQGLRAVMRAWDGRGPASALTALLQPWRGVGPGDLPALVHGSPDHKVVIASFARVVLQAAAQGDEPSLVIVERAAEELAIGVLAVARRAGLQHPFEVALAGSLLVSGEHALLRERLCSLLARNSDGAVDVAHIDSPLDAVAQLSRVIQRQPELTALLARSLPFGRFRSPQFVQEIFQHA